MSIPKVRKESKFVRYMKGARDFYVRSLTSCAGNTAYGGAAVGLPSLHFSSPARSFSADSSYSGYCSREQEDLRELIRIASARSLTGKVEAELRRSPVVSRSRTVCVHERIDEDKPCEYGVGPKVISYTLSTFPEMKKLEKERKFHEALLKLLHPPPSPPPSDNEGEEKEDDQTEANLIESLNGLPEEETDNEGQSASNSDDNSSDRKMTRAQRKRLRKRKLKEAATHRRKIIGPLLPPASNDGSDRSNVGTNVSGDLSVEVMNSTPEGVRQNAAVSVSEEEASCLNKHKLKLKQRRKSKKIAKSAPSSTSDQNHGLKIRVDDDVDS